MAGRDISVSKMALGSSRVMGTCAVGGQAAGTAAALAVKYQCKPRDVQKHIKELQQILIMDDCWIPGCKNEDTNDMARNAKVLVSGFKPQCTADNIINGFTRKIGENENCWESEKLDDNGASIKLCFKEPVSASQVRIVFDPDLSREIMISMTASVQKREDKFMPPQLVKDFSITFRKAGETILEKTIIDNNQRLCIINTDKPLEVDEVIVNISKTYGSDSARVYEIRVY